MGCKIRFILSLILFEVLVVSYQCMYSNQSNKLSFYWSTASIKSEDMRFSFFCYIWNTACLKTLITVYFLHAQQDSWQFLNLAFPDWCNVFLGFPLTFDQTRQNQTSRKWLLLQQTIMVIIFPLSLFTFLHQGIICVDKLRTEAISRSNYLRQIGQILLSNCAKLFFISVKGSLCLCAARQEIINHHL